MPSKLETDERKQSYSGRLSLPYGGGKEKAWFIAGGGGGGGAFKQHQNVVYKPRKLNACPWGQATCLPGIFQQTETYTLIYCWKKRSWPHILSLLSNMCAKKGLSDAD